MPIRALLVAALVAAAGAFPAPAWANGNSAGSTFAIALTDFPEMVYLGSAMNGTLSITLKDDGTDAARQAQVLIYVNTPLGRAVVSQTPLTLKPGETREVRVRCEVDEHAATGPFTFGVQVLVDAEALRLEHEVYIVGGK